MLGIVEFTCSASAAAPIASFTISWSLSFMDCPGIFRSKTEWMERYGEDLCNAEDGKREEERGM